MFLKPPVFCLNYASTIGLPGVFSDSKTEALKTTHEKEVMALYQEIGQLSTQMAWLKKKSGLA